MVARIRHNAGLKMLALALAILGWAYFRFASNPFISAKFTQQFTVPIAAINVPNGYLVKFTDKVESITIEPKRGDPPVKADQIKAVLDLSNRGAGVFNVPVQIVAPSVAIQSLSPGSVTLSIEKIEQKQFAVGIHYAGQPNVVVSDSKVSPAAVQVFGPSMDLSQVASVRVEMPLDTSKSRFDRMIRPVAVDSNGQELTDVRVVPDLVRVQAQFLPATNATHAP
ncbi:MAG TPA: CdaR family protein [Candidatus Baltobacteraceae bacterium]|nr:CdaR family protein [Candidatus Baltobacteraceae bacterium]